MAGRPGLHVFVTHDLYVATVAAVGLALGSDESLAPWFLDGAFIWESDRIYLRYKDKEGVIEWPQRSKPEKDALADAARTIV